MKKEIGRLAVPGQPDRIVYASPATPPEIAFDIPQENIIHFPDKKTIAVDWRKTFKVVTDAGRVIEAAEIVQEEGTYRVPFSNPEVPYAIGFNFSDGHIGSWTTDHEKIQEVMELVLTTPNSFLADTGDTFDNGIWGGLQHENALPTYMQTFTVADIMRELGDKYAACVIGNHTEWMFTVAGVKPEVMFAEQMKGPVFAGMGLLHLEVGSQKYDWALAHNYWGMSKKNIFNVCVNLRQQEFPTADIFSVGHEHIWGHMEEMVDGRKVLYIRPGTAKTKDRYARIHGIAKRGQGFGIAVMFRADKKEFTAYSLEDACQLMKLRTEIAQFKT